MNKGKEEENSEQRKEGRKLSNEKEDNEGCTKERQKALCVRLNTGGVTHSGLWQQDSVSRDSAMMQKALSI